MNNQVVSSSGNGVVLSQAQEAAKAKALDYLTSMGLNLPQAQKEQFIELCVALELNPFKREIYAVGYGSKFNIIVGYETYLKKADATRKCEGWHVKTEGSVANNDLKAIIEIHRKDYKYPFVHEVDYSEYKQEFFKDGKLVQSFWQTKPKTMIKKVAMAQGFRLAFPNDFRDMPYIEEELQQQVEGGVNLPSQKSLADLSAALNPLGITLEVKGTSAIAKGAVFNNNLVLKELGFVYNKDTKSWVHNNVANTENIIEAEVEEAQPSTDVAQSTQAAHKSMADFKSMQELDAYLGTLGIKIDEIKQNDKGVAFGKIDDAKGNEAELQELGAINKNNAWILNLGSLYVKQTPDSAEQDLATLF